MLFCFLGYLLPGISGYMTIVISLCIKREDSQHTYFVTSQMQFPLRDIDDFIARQTIPLSFSRQIMVSLAQVSAAV